VSNDTHWEQERDANKQEEDVEMSDVASEDSKSAVDESEESYN